MLGRDEEPTDEVKNPHQLRWLRHALRMANYRLPERAMLSDIGVD